MSGKMYLVQISEKVNQVTKNLRRLWPKYDTDLDQQISQMQVIVSFIEHAFKDSNLYQDYLQLQKAPERQETIQQLIYQEANIDPINFQDPNFQLRIDPEITLNQSQIINVMKRYYLDRSSTDPNKSGGVTEKKERLQNSNKKGSFLAEAVQEDYKDYYLRVKNFAHERNWDEKKFQKMLCDKESFEREYKLFKLKQNAMNQNIDPDVPMDMSYRRLHDLAMEKKAKIARIQEEKEQNEIFQAYQMSQMPLSKKYQNSSMNKSSVQEGVRTLEQFMEDQIKYEQKRYDNLKQAIIKEEEQEQYLFQPKITQKSVEILMNKQVDPVEASKLKKMKREQQYLQERKEKEYFHPIINESARKMQRGLDPLMEDASKRQQSKRILSEMQQTKLNYENNSFQISSNSDKFMYDRFEYDFSQCCQEISLIPQQELDQDHLINTNDFGIDVSCAQMSQLFLNMGFVTADGKENEQLALANIWKIIGGDENGQINVPLQRVKTMMCAIQNFHIDWLIDNERDDQAKVNPLQIGRIDDKQLLLISDEITFLTKKYIKLYKNRMDKLANDKKKSHITKAIQKKKLGDQFEFKPTISKKNQQLAEQKMQKEPAYLQLSFEDRLIKEKFDIQKKREELKALKDFQQEDQPYRPQVSEKSRRIVQSRSISKLPNMNESQYSISTTKWDLLYQESKKRLDKRDYQQDEIEFKKEKDEYTFQPNVYKKQNMSLMEHKRSISTQSQNQNSIFSSNLVKKKQNIKPQLDQGRMRMQNQLKNRNGPDDHDEEIQDEEDDDKDGNQTFQISVNIGGQKKQIQAHLDADASTIAYRFIQEHGVDKKFHSTLTQLIEDQLNKIKANAINDISQN